MRTHPLPGDLTPKEEEFLRLCREHDLTFEFSDDHRYWKAGSSERQVIIAMAKANPDIRAKEIWDHVSSTKIRCNEAEEFERRWAWQEAWSK
jgi:hypothetical protein